MPYYLNKVLARPFDAAVDPVASMQTIDNLELKRAAEQARVKLEKLIAPI
jgi:hypothetical protein